LQDLAEPIRPSFRGAFCRDQVLTDLESDVGKARAQGVELKGIAVWMVAGIGLVGADAKRIVLAQALEHGLR
jgi:hypothetical protein